MAGLTALAISVIVHSSPHLATYQTLYEAVWLLEVTYVTSDSCLLVAYGKRVKYPCTNRILTTRNFVRHLHLSGFYVVVRLVDMPETVGDANIAVAR